VQRDVLDQMLFKPEIADRIATMEPAIFTEGPMGLAARWRDR
jgi:acyl CoA:acetate/3-ketoacid CoA transferase